MPPRSEWKQVSLDELHEDPANARKHGQRNRNAVRSSLREFGQVETLVVEAGTGRVLGGNCRLAELRAMGVQEAMVCEVDVHGVDATRLALALNRTAELAEWDQNGLEALLRDLDEAGAVAGIGWEEDELGDLFGGVDDDLPEPDGAEDQSDQLEYQFRILVECRDESDQLVLLEKFEREGIRCRAYML